MILLDEHCTFHSLTHETPIRNFICDNDDLNDFFKNDAIKYQDELLGETYFFRHKESGDIVCAYTISNDSIRVDDLPNSRKKKVTQNIPHSKGMKSYPATLIGRLGVAKKIEGQRIGSQLLNFIKSSCLIEEGNRCRFLLVDAYNNTKTIGYYYRNEFQFVFSTEQQESEYYERPIETELKTRFMFFDLKLWLAKSGL